MATRVGIRSHIYAGLAMFFAASSASGLIASEPGVSHALAISRAGRLSNIHYQLSFAIKDHQATVEGTEYLSFDSRTDGDLLIDYRDGVVHSVELNGQPIPTQIENGHLSLAAKAGENIVKLAFTSNAATAGKAITRYEDKDDG